MLDDKLAEIALQGKSYFCGISTEMSSGTGREGKLVGKSTTRLKATYHGSRTGYDTDVYLDLVVGS